MMRPPKPRRTDIHRGDVWQVDFDPTVGAEIRKERPAVVVSHDGMGRLPLRLVVPITEWQTRYANFTWFTYLPATPSNGLAKESAADAFQIKSVSEDRFGEKLGMLTVEQMNEIVDAIALCVGFRP